MTVAPLSAAAPVVPPAPQPGYIESSLQWLVEKISELVYFVFSYFCSEKSPDLAPPEGVREAILRATPSSRPPEVPSPKPPEVPFDQLPEEELRRRCAETLQYFEDMNSDLNGVYKRVGRAVGCNKWSPLDWFRSYEVIGRREALKNPVLLQQHAANALQPHFS